MDGKARSGAIALSAVLLVSVLSAVLAILPEEVSAYTLRSQIYIHDNFEFNSGNGVVRGTGTVNDPYIIEGWEINHTGIGYGIIVANTDKYFEIRNCFVHGVTWDGSHSIYFFNVKNGAVKDSNLTDSHRGIHLIGSSGVVVSGCNITGNGYGIHSESSTDIHVSDCLIQDNSQGFSLEGSGNRNCTFTRNNVSDNFFGGVIQLGINLTITDNTFYGNSGDGLDLGSCEQCNVSGNRFDSNIMVGLYLGRTRNSTLYSNVFFKDGLGIFGEEPAHWTSHIIGSDNLVNGLPLQLLKNVDSVDVDGASIGALIVANSTNVRVTNLTIGGTDLPIAAAYSTGFTVENCTVTEALVGVRLECCEEVVVQMCDIINATLDPVRLYAINSATGISAYRCAGLQILENSIVHPDYGIYMNECPNSTVSGNYISDGLYSGGIAGSSCDNSLILLNEISSKDTGISFSSSNNFTLIGNLVSDMHNNAMYLYNMTEVSVIGNSFIGNGFGLRMDQITNASYIANEITGTYCLYNPNFDSPCFELRNSQNIEIMGNVLTGNENGLYMYHCTMVDILANDFTLQENEGVYMEWCNDFSVSLCNISSNGEYGIHMRSCYGILELTDCLVYDNLVGIFADQSSPSIIGNEILGNAGGLWLLSASWTEIYGNDFIANGEHVSVSNSMFVAWNDVYPNGGNYWDNYSGADVLSGPSQNQSGSDGIGDVLMSIADSHDDMYPLMSPTGTNRPPVASFSVDPGIGDTTTVFTFNASDSWDYEDNSTDLEFRWDFDGDGNWDTGWSSEKTVNRTFLSQGTYNVTLEVRDSNGTVGSRVIQIVVLDMSIPEFPDTLSLAVSMLGILSIALALARRRSRS